MDGIQDDAGLLPDRSSHRVDTKPVVFAHLLVMVFNAAPCPSNISSAQKDGPDLIGSKNLLGYVLHKGKRARPSVLPAHGWLCE